jgi:hypothetical protein
MSPLETVDPRAEVHDNRDQVAEAARERALKLVSAGVPISAKEFAAIRREHVGTFHKRRKLGAFDDFVIPGAIGPKRYSAVKVQRYLNGEVVDEPRRSFGRRRA